MSSSSSVQQALQAIEQKIEALLQEHQKLTQENNALRNAEQRWQLERTRLIEKNELARTRVEAMITRLKSLESNA
ncbi:TIGR02449 family protein [Halioxenophilus sp. WMMB6]|uniref:TIGR02449 family protein n=1 Tax=Halioxenophilus sp. WMMB6 TaxID=3073815 RepID=UPI00295E4C92|nr:TIGR02449 family protein [Halioxenophilus sp. WMMB6]